MLTVNASVICPKCKATNSYSIITNELIDSDLYTTYQCDCCGHIYTNIYGLVYMGGYNDMVRYDKDNITTKR